jgi:predicted metal-dependent peptidase
VSGSEPRRGAVVSSEHRGTPAIEAMIECAPATGGLALWARHRDVDEALLAAWMGCGGQVPEVATDGHTLFYAPGFDTRPMAEQIGLVAHATLHLALRHPQRRTALAASLGDIDLALFNTCADALVNSMLAQVDWLRLPAGAVSLEGVLAEALGLRQTAAQALMDWDVERLYRQIDDRQPASERSGQRVERGGEALGGAVLSDGPRAATVRRLGRAQAPDLLSPERTGASTAPDVQAEPELARAWGERLSRAHAGDGSFSMLRPLGLELADRRMPWEHLLRSRVARGLVPQRSLSWSRPSRSWLANRGRTRGGGRMPWEPGWTSARRVSRLVLVVDVSASIDDLLLQRFGAELRAITRRCEADWVLIAGDTEVSEVRRLAPGQAPLLPAGLAGGGGTDFTPLLEAAHRERPDLCLVLTDLDGPLRFDPPWPLLWVVPPGWTGLRPCCGSVIELI